MCIILGVLDHTSQGQKGSEIQVEWRPETGKTKQPREGHLRSSVVGRCIIWHRVRNVSEKPVVSMFT